ncbi:MAG TPA: hypothetical protein VHY79_07030 [Rhizomicrobium sp.]|jgi:hypothetical protein|nr:hypothetical protein [Rhizomicrobium sp.]
MSQLNFSVNAPQPTIRQRAYNPRGKVLLRSNTLVWQLVSIAAVMAAVFTIVWFV